MINVIFKKLSHLRNFEALINDGYRFVDMHCHTRYSNDGLTDVNALIKKCRKSKVGAAITDHNAIGGSLKAKNAKGAFMIPGIEVSCKNGAHVLVHFYSYSDLSTFFNRHLKKTLAVNPWFVKYMPAEIVDIASGYNCLVTAPHPFGPGFTGLMKFKAAKSIIKKMNAIEVINGCCFRHMNRKAMALADSLKKPVTGGSDGHCLSEIGKIVTACKADTVEEFLEQIKKGKSIAIGKEEKFFVDAIHTIIKLMHERKVLPHDLLKSFYKERKLHEIEYLKARLEDKLFHHHFYLHHHHVRKEMLEHEYARHLAKYR